MRKSLGAIVVAILTLGGFSAGVQAASHEGPAAGAPSESPSRLDAVAMRPIEPPKCDSDDPVDRYVRCINRYLTRLAKNVDDALGQLSAYIDACLFAQQVTLYGIPPTEGYVYRPPAPGVDFLAQALSYTADPATQPFQWVVHVQDRCVDPV